MNIKFTKHAKIRLKERGLSVEVIKEAIENVIL